MKTLFINAAGTANGYFLAETAKNKFGKSGVRVIVGDTKPPHFIAASKFADRYVQTPSVHSRGFRAAMMKIFKTHNVGFYLPLFPEDCVQFPFCDGEKPVSLSIPKRSVSLFKDKFVQHRKIKDAGIAVEDFFETLALARKSGLTKKEIIAKTRQGSGSTGVFDCSIYALERIEDELFFVDKCGGVERTVDVLNWEGKVWTVTRERIAIKAGVTTQTRAYFCPEHNDIARRLCSRFQLPTVFCFQTMENRDSKTVIIDLNARIGAGTSMSRLAGIDFAYNLIGLSLGLIDKPKVGKVSEKIIVRVYRDVAMK